MRDGMYQEKEGFGDGVSGRCDGREYVSEEDTYKIQKRRCVYEGGHI